MVRLFLVCVVLIGLEIPLWAGTVTFTFGGNPVTLTTTAGQDTFLARLRVRENAHRAALTPSQSALTLEEYVRDIVVTALGRYRLQAETVDQSDACENFRALTVGQRNTIITTLGDRNPCP
jgi:hypothetical protein